MPTCPVPGTRHVPPRRGRSGDRRRERTAPRMEHTAPPVVELVRWQTATLVASAIAAIELIVLVVLGLVFLADPAAGNGHAAAADTPRALARVKPKPAVPHLPRSKTSVVILNGN